MLRTPQSRMDILTPEEISSINRSSELVRKYSEVIDRESAYEILGGKIARMEKDAAGRAAEEAERKEWERRERENGRGGERERYPQRTYTTRRSSGRSVEGQVVKVLTSATFIRGIFGVLSKVLKK
jgi:septal ring factor EnvC (AmiA/AmiB activator)